MMLERPGKGSRDSLGKQLCIDNVEIGIGKW